MSLSMSGIHGGGKVDGLLVNEELDEERIPHNRELEGLGMVGRI